MPSLVAASGPLAGSRFVVRADAVVGRSPSCEIALPDSRASRRHARLELAAGQLRVVDLGSRNGTYVNGERLTGARALEPGDRVTIGGTAFVVDPPLAAEVAEGGQAEPDSAHLPEELLPFAGTEGVLLQTCAQLLSAGSVGAVLRRVAEELVRALGADVVSALLLQEGSLVQVAAQGAREVAVPRGLVKAVVEERKVARLGDAAGAPLLLRAGEPAGLLFAARAGEPFGRDELSLLASVSRLSAQAMNALEQRERAPEAEAMLVGQSRAFRRVLELSRKVAHSELGVTLVGEAGTGKQLLARFSVARGPRAVQPVEAVDLRDPAAEALLYGGRARASAFARADGGTLLLLGLDALARPLATRLLDTLQRGLAPGPDGGELRFDVRLYATSREPCARLAVRGELPFELTNLLAGVELEVPPLRERPGDLPLLLAHFAERFRRGRSAAMTASDEALAALSEYPFPANVREVRGLVERLALLEVAELRPSHLPPEMRTLRMLDDAPLAARVEAVEREAITSAMARAGGKKVEAARRLGISRPTLDKKLAEYELGHTRKRPAPGRASAPHLPEDEP